MSGVEFKDTQRPFEAIVSVIADDPYVTYVVGRLESGDKIDHDVKNWNREMLGHLQEKYDVSLNIGHAAISKCRLNLRQAMGAEAHVVEA